MSRFADQVVWITGASSGIGEALAGAFARDGARLILSSRRTEELRRVADACGGAPERVRVLPLDLTESDTLAAKAREAESQFGRIDILVNNGGISQRSPAKDTDLSVDRRIMEINFFSAVTLTRAVLPAMLARRAGRIVVIGSVVGKFATPRRSAYAASKHALQGWFDALRAELRGSGVGVTMVCPGLIRTNISLNALRADGSRNDQMDKGQENGMSPDRCAQAVLRATAAGRREIYPGGPETWAVLLNRLFPGLFARLIARAAIT